MNFSDVIIILLLLACVWFWHKVSLKECPKLPEPQVQIVYRYKPELDLQFNENNFPSKIYDYVFTGRNVAQGGYQLASTTLKTDRLKETVKKV